MKIDEFWSLIEDLPRSMEELSWIDRIRSTRSATSFLGPEPDVYTLSQRLKKLSDDEFVSFATHFRKLYLEMYRWDIWGAAYIIQGGCGDDTFSDVRSGLISRGRRFVETALSSPDDLAELLGSDEDWLAHESFGYVNSREAERRGGSAEEAWEAMIERLPYDGPKGEDWDFDDPTLNSQRLPKIVEKFGAWLKEI